MANRIITAAVTGETIKLSNKTAGAAGSFNAVSLSLTFDSAWDGTTKKLYFFDAYGNNAVYRLLTTELLVDGAYIVPIPAEPLAYAGEMTITIRGIDFATDGTTAERIIVSASTTMKVLSAIAPASDVAPVEPTPTQAEQLQGEIDGIINEVAAIPASVTACANSATASANSATASATSATAAQTAQAASESARDLAVSAKTAAQTAETNAETAQTAAETARTGAQTAETNAGTYATNAGNSATAASGSATDANSAKVAAQTAQTAAETARTNAETAETNAETAETNAKTSETNAALSASAASTSASNASSSASEASSSATNASSSASAAASSASASSSSASAADSAKTAAASSASEAATSASNAASSATAAANSAASLVVVNDLTTGGTTNALSAEQGKTLSTSISELKAQELQSTCMVHPRLPNGVINTFENGSFVERVKKYVIQASDVTITDDTFADATWVLVAKQTDDVLYGNSNTNITTSLQKIVNGFRPVAARNIGEPVGGQVNYSATNFALSFAKGTTLAQARATLTGTVIYYQLATYNTIALPTTKTPNTQELNRLSEKTAYLDERLSYGVYSGLGVTQQTTADMTVAVATGTIYMDTGTRFAPSAVTALAITAADATNPRIDIVYVNSSGVIAYLAGTAAASPSAPSVPTGGQKLAEISVSANATTIVAANIADRRKYIWCGEWIYPTMSNGWTALAGYPAAYMVDDSGEVKFKGRIIGTSNFAFQIVAALRPSISIKQAVFDASTTCKQAELVNTGAFYPSTSAVTYIDLSSFRYCLR